MSKRTDAEIRRVFGARLQRILMERGLSQAAAARLCTDISRSNMSDWIKGLNLPSPAKLKDLADGLQVEIDDLLPPDAYEDAGTPQPPKFATEEMPDGRVMIRVNQVVSRKVAARISAALLDDGD